MEWKDEYKISELWTGEEVIDLLCGNKPDNTKADNPEKKKAKEAIRRAVKANTLKPVGEIPDDPAFRLYGPGHDFNPIDIARWVVKRKIFNKFPYKPQDFEEHTLPEELDDKLEECEYWQTLKQKVKKAIEQYPTWRSNNPRGNKENLNDWLINVIGANTRESQIINHVLTDVFIDLK